MKRTLKIGAYGWRQAHWLNTFYPEDLPVTGDEDWRLAYYSNEFSTVLVPADYWKKQGNQEQIVDCESWLNDVSEDFQFFVECHGGMFEDMSFDEIADELQLLQSQLSGFVFLDGIQTMPATLCEQLLDLAGELNVDVFSNDDDDDDDDDDAAIEKQVGKIWQQKEPVSSKLAFLEDDLTNLRLMRTIVDEFMSQAVSINQDAYEATMIINHPNLQVKDLSQLQAVIEIMGH